MSSTREENSECMTRRSRQRRESIRVGSELMACRSRSRRRSRSGLRRRGRKEGRDVEEFEVMRVMVLQQGGGVGPRLGAG
jgi:hypothetical protein